MTELAHGHGIPHAYETEESKTAAKVRTFYHGTNMPDLTHILPAAHVNREVHYPGLSDKNYAYATTNLEDAWTHAQNAHTPEGTDDEITKKDIESRGRPRVYEVRPIGGHHTVEKDPEYDPETGAHRDPEPGDHRSPHGFKVVRELEPPKDVSDSYPIKHPDHWVHEWHVPKYEETGDMPKQGARWMPKERLFGRTYGLDHRLFDGDRLRKDVRDYIIGTLNSFWRPMFGPGWKKWAKVYFAGSEASEWTSQALEGNNDFDILIGVDYDKFRSSVGGMSDKDDDTITSALNSSFREGLDPRTENATIFIDGQATGPWENTWYVNKNSYDIKEIRPYAAYDVIADDWAVRPPHLPEWSTKAFPEGKGLEKEIRGILDMAKGILAMPEPYRTQNGRALWEFVHTNRSDAFGPQGEGWYDPRNVIEKALDQAGLMQKLWALMDHARQNPHLLDSPVGWSNDPAQ